MTPSDRSFPRRYRLNSARDFDHVFKAATVRQRHGALRISAVPNRMHTARLGLVVGKRAVRKAHDRNRVRRVLRETFRQTRSQLPAMDLVVQVTADDVSNAALRGSFAMLLMRLQEEPQ